VMRFDKKQYFIDSFGLIAIGMFSMAYILFSVRFAELHIQLLFLDFPIFVGEILLFLCIALFFVKYIISPPSLNKWHYVLILYFAFVVAKALYGYDKWGPLAFRNAALLYYPVFAVLGYSLYRRDFFEGEKIFFFCSIFILFFINFVSQTFNIYWSLSIPLIAFIFIKSFSSKRARYLMLALLLILIPYKWIFLTSRMMLVSNIITGLYLITAFFLILKLNIRVKVVLAALCVALIALGILKFSNPVRAKSIFAFRGIAKVFNDYDKRVQADIDYFEMGELKDIKLYQPEGGLPTFEIPFSDFMARQETKLAKNKQEQYAALIQKKKAQGKVSVSQKQEKYIPAQEEQVLRDAIAEEAVENRMIEEIIEELKAEGYVGEANLEELAAATVEGKYVDRYHLSSGLNNAVFRLLIWRDMIVELYKKKPVIGFDFGKPLRSISLEILKWGWHNWGLNGWVPAHNSHLHIIYRTGVIGIVFLLTVFIVLFKMIIKFIQWKSVVGILLCGIILNWFIAANFLLILELPYTAVPVWSLYGITFAYFLEQKRLKHEFEK